MVVRLPHFSHEHKIILIEARPTQNRHHQL
jgi:hypothetical protein